MSNQAQDTNIQGKTKVHIVVLLSGAFRATSEEHNKWGAAC